MNERIAGRRDLLKVMGLVAAGLALYPLTCGGGWGAEKNTPDIVERLLALLKKYEKDGRTRERKGTNS